MFYPASVRVRGPLQAHVEGFFAELLRQGYAPLSAGNVLRVAAHLGRWLEVKGLVLGDLSEDVAAAFLRHRRRRGYTQFLTRRALGPLLSYLRRAGVVPTPAPVVDASPAGRLLRDYVAYLRQERGLAATTIRGYTDFATGFVRSERPRLDWGALTPQAVTRFVLGRARHASSIATCKLMVTHLRSLLRFLHVRGAIGRDLSTCTPAVAGWRLSGLPKAIEQSQVDQILSTPDDSPTGLRRAAIVRLLVRLGLRAGEVSALDLEDVDWRSGELRVSGKGRHDSRLPLPPDVGRAVAAYLRRGRAHVADRALFLRSRAPHTRLRPGGVCQVAQAALATVGLAGGAHRFRHTAATQMLQHGASLSEIAQVLRHRSLGTTAIYAKVDLAALGAVARPWPGGTP